ncbi:hypothetical protein FN846DRAFT_372497 [Sphaerosporella brunnea]|uniref:Uncharacterized protein n=1 Tax=Sphaerosporella brunnea TaxID=1250544 RepID=A0A5J5EIH5_9PEZI|nr:hypothetical protein FN846DRAFT_372497 [Sphaerosporella brunnea]
MSSPHSSYPRDTTPQPSAPAFQPFFTLIAPTSSNPSHAHPHVHYIFSDDDVPPLAASADSRVITVDIDFTPSHRAYVKSAASLSPDFALASASIQEAPSMLGTDDGAGLMLSIEGVEAGLKGVKASAGVWELARVFGERMETLRRVVEWGGGGEVLNAMERGKEEGRHAAEIQDGDETVTETEGETSDEGGGGGGRGRTEF